MPAFKKALRPKPEGFFFCPAFLPPKRILTACATDFRRYESFAACGDSSEETTVNPRTAVVSFLSRRVREPVPALLFAPSLYLGVRGVRRVPLQIPCHCTLCDIEAQLLAELTGSDSGSVTESFSNCPKLLQHSTIGSVLTELRNAPADAANDNLFREIFSLRETNPTLAEGLLVLAFLPMLHRAVRLINRQQQSLAEEDIAQQILFFLFQFLDSPEMAARRSHFAYATAREVKRHIFEWAKRESAKAAMLDHADSEAEMFVERDGSFEQYALLRHFLHRCLKKGMLANSELDLLIQFKLDGNTGNELAALNGSSSNAVRQRFKRLLAKLRRLAQ